MEQFFFAGKKMTREEFVDKYNLQGDSFEAQQLIIEKLIKKGKIIIMDNTPPDEKMMKAPYKEFELEAKIAELECESEAYETYKHNLRKEGKLCYEEVEIDFGARTHAFEFLDYTQRKLKLEGRVIEKDGLFVVVLNNVSESDLTKIRTHQLANKAGEVMINGTKIASQTFINSFGYVMNVVGLPVAQATLSAGMAVAKQTLKSATQIGSTAINSAVDNSKQFANEIKNDQHILMAKKNLVDAKDALFRMMKKKSGTSNIRIK